MHQLEKEARLLCEKGEFDAALRLCDNELSRAPHLAFLIFLRKNIADCRRVAVLATIRQISLQLRGDDNPHHHLNILEAALVRFPDEPYLKAMLARVRQESDEVQNRIAMIRSAALEGRFEEAHAFLDTLENLGARNPELVAENYN